MWGHKTASQSGFHWKTTMLNFIEMLVKMMNILRDFINWAAKYNPKQHEIIDYK